MLTLRDEPAPGGRTEEGLRVAVGLTISNPNLTVVLLDRSAIIASSAFDWTGHEAMAKHWQTLPQLGVRIVAEQESVDLSCGPGARLADGVETWPRNRVAALLAEAEVVVSY